MSGGFELQPRDGGPRVALAPGETVIGRGPLLGITDKRVSRRHAIVEVVGGQLRIKPIHTNPCFYQSSKRSELLPMKNNLWHWLNPGDTFSLLVDKYVFRVFSTKSETELECTLRNSQMLDEDDIPQETPESPVVNSPDKTPGASQLERNTEMSRAQTTATASVSFAADCGDFGDRQLNPAQRKRILPAWMLADHLSDENSSVSVISEGSVIQENGKDRICENKTQVNITQQGRKRSTSSGNSETILAEQDTGKKCKTADQEEAVISSKEKLQSLAAISLSRTEMYNKKTATQRDEILTEEFGEVSEQKFVTKETPSREDQATGGSESCLSTQDNESEGPHPESSSDPLSPELLRANTPDSVPQGSKENGIKRTSCMYGANCYRKNPVHFQHFSHPGDSDYEDVPVPGQEETDDRPECPYGASCYRKNPQHKIEYRHNTFPVRNAVDEDNEQPDDCDLSDSFQEDEEECDPTDEDPDWEPGKEDEEKEDVQELLREAKKFLKRKK
ncbi:aprataxin and PNK-like factor isoform X2 [Ochotona curzoniae]|uniref:aprataxin and PNK-like factor isoform X2 n=1 Tax=Ochotona curzoniae TaxID=130825 RepID=UPI001B346390|nr:aprataxin and PNK-like factor isoform X2 [Ochotona curzoniae]